MDLSEDSRALICLSARLGIGDIEPLRGKEIHLLQEALPTLGQIFQTPRSELIHKGISEELLERSISLVNRASGVMSSLVRLEEMGIRPVTLYDDEYPINLKKKLGSGAPQILFYSGDLTHLDSDGIGIVGSRNVDKDGLKAAEAIAQNAVKLGYPVVSGGAAGIDQAAMRSAVESGGVVVTSLGHSLVKGIEPPEAQRLLYEGQIMFLTPYGPEDHFSIGLVMGNNRIIYALSKTTVVVASEKESGGTWAGATEAMRKKFGHVTVWDGDGRGSGNDSLIGMGASRLSNPTDLPKILENIVEPTRRETYEQKRLI